jgi:hypothetical protein
LQLGAACLFEATLGATCRACPPGRPAYRWDVLTVAIGALALFSVGVALVFAVMGERRAAVESVAVASAPAVTAATFAVIGARVNEGCEDTRSDAIRITAVPSARAMSSGFTTRSSRRTLAPIADPAGRYGARRQCDHCGGTFTLSPHTPGWVATSKPHPAWVCPDCARGTGMQPGDPIPEQPTPARRIRLLCGWT